MNNSWYELQVFENGWFNWRDDGMVYDSVAEALNDFTESTCATNLPRGYRVVEINAVIMGEGEWEQLNIKGLMQSNNGTTTEASHQ